MKKRIILFSVTTVILAGVLGLGWGLNDSSIAKPPSSHTTKKPTTPFYFVQITDTHFPSDENARRTTKAVEEINKLPMDIACVVHTGDILANAIENGKAIQQSRDILDKLNAPLLWVPGNHDILQRKDKLEKTTEIFRAKYGKLCSSTNFHGVVFVTLYTEPLARGFEIKGYDPLAELERELSAAGDNPVIVFHHAPSVEDFYDNEMHPGWLEQAKEKWIKLINKHNVKAVITGHFHRAEQHWLGNVPLYVAPPISDLWGRQGSFRIYEYRDGKVSFRTRYIAPAKKE